MGPPKSYRRLPLRELMADAEKRSRDIVERLNGGLLEKVADLRELSRPVRKKSHYPTVVALQNSMHKVVELTTETGELIEYLEKQLLEIRDHARRERFNRN
jgi:hypothetical protein